MRRHTRSRHASIFHIEIMKHVVESNLNSTVFSVTKNLQIGTRFLIINFTQWVLGFAQFLDGDSLKMAVNLMYRQESQYFRQS